jgi:osmotically inducible lipoprotein OsmB
MEGAMKRVAVVVVAGMTLSGCFNWPTGNPVVNGAIVGGVTGAVIGGVASGNVGGAAIGGGIGAATGALIGAAVR